MPLSDYFPEMKGWQTAQPQAEPMPQIPDHTTQVSPYLRATLPLPLQYSPDTLKQYNRPGLSAFRTAPLPPNALPTINAAASSVQTSISNSTSGGSSSDDVESINVNIQNGTSYSATSGDRNTLISMTNNSGGTILLPGTTTQGSYFVQQATAPFGPSPSTASMVNGGGNLLVVVAKCSSGTPTVHDSLGNTYHFICSATDTGGGTGAMYYVSNCLAGANTITIGGGTGPSALILEYTNALTSGTVVDVSATATSQQSGLPTVTTNFNTEMAVYGHFVNSGGSYTPGAGWTARLAGSTSIIEDQSILSSGTLVVPTFGGASGSFDTLAMLSTFRMNPITQNLTAGVPKGWFCYIENTGTGTFYVLGNPTIDGGSNTVALPSNEGALFVYDGVAWRSVRGAPNLVIPSTFSPISHQFLTGYNATTGVFSAAQPAFSDLSGNISTSQMNGGTGASSSTFWRGDGTWQSIFYQTVQQAGTARTQRGVLNFLAPITATDNSGNNSTDIAVPNFVGDSGSGGVKGLVPAPAAGDAAAGKFLKADGTWSAGGVSGVTALNSLTGSLSLTSSDSSVTIIPSGTTIDLQATGGGGGAPTNALYVVGAANGSLSQEAVNPTAYYGTDVAPASPGSLDDEFNGSSLDTVRWTWQNQGSATATVAKSILYLNAPANSGINFRWISQSTPSTPWKVAMKMGATYGGNFNFCNMGLVVSDGTKLIVFTVSYNSGSTLAVQRYNSNTSFSTSSKSETFSSSFYNMLQWRYLSVGDDGTNLTYYISTDGQNWIQFFQQARLAFLSSVSLVGICADAESTSSDAAINVDWFRRIL